jgi:formate-dependent nitrite reductase membrane component NrfD
MLRVLKLRSPMSLGTWGLSVYGLFATLSAGVEAARDGVLGRRGRPIGVLPSSLIGLLAAPSGFFVGGYTGVLLGATAVPLWARNVRLLGPLFLSSSVAAACGLISLVLALLPGRRAETLARLHRAERCALAIQAVAEVAVELKSGRAGRPLHKGRLGRVHLGGSIGAGLVVPMLVHELGARLGLPQRLTSIVGGLSSVAGALTLKYVIVIAGQESANDPAATFEFAGGRVPAPPTQAGQAAR